jgi:hypothetical protein
MGDEVYSGGGRTLFSSTPSNEFESIATAVASVVPMSTVKRVGVKRMMSEVRTIRDERGASKNRYWNDEAGVAETDMRKSQLLYADIYLQN